MKIATKTRVLAFPGPVGRAWLVLAAAACFACAGWVGGASIDLAGASGMPHATAANLFGFVLPGALVAAVAIAIYLGASLRLGRIATLIALFSALAFAGQGIFPLQLGHSEATGSRLHAMCWSLWWLTIATAATLGACDSRQGRGAWRIGSIAVALLVAGFALFASAFVGSVAAQEIACGLWFAWWLAAAALSGNAASMPGSSPPTRR